MYRSSFKVFYLTLFKHERNGYIIRRLYSVNKEYFNRKTLIIK
jgi:hypothetical protein